MQIDIHREKKIVCIWLTRKESSEYKNEKSPILTPLFEGYRKRKYHIAVFMFLNFAPSLKDTGFTTKWQ